MYFLFQLLYFSPLSGLSLYFSNSIEIHTLFIYSSPEFVKHFYDLYLPYNSNGKESACSAWDLGLIPGLGRSSREGNGNPLQYSCLENSMSRGAWWAIVCGVARRRTRLSDWHYNYYCVITTAAAAAKSLQSCPTLCDPIPGILQARNLEWVAISFFNASSGLFTSTLFCSFSQTSVLFIHLEHIPLASNFTEFSVLFLPIG